MLSNRERSFRDLLLHELVKPYLDGLILIRDVGDVGDVNHEPATSLTTPEQLTALRNHSRCGDRSV